MNNILPKACILKRIRYETSGGSMNFHSEFELEATEAEIVRTCYYSDYFFDKIEAEAPREELEKIDQSHRTEKPCEEINVREHIPMYSGLWQALCEEMEYLKPRLRPVENRPAPKLPPDVFVLDGGDYTRLYLTWEIDGTEQGGQYYSPSGKRWSSVIDILHEMARPLGRDLHRIGETVIADFFLKTPKYSYQISPVTGGSSYYFHVHGDSSDKNRLSAEEWQTVRQYLSGLDLSKFKAGRYESKFYLRLNYSDGLSKNLEIDKKTAELIRSFIRKNI